MNQELSRLSKVDLREVWNNEATDFTPWLAMEENLGLLGDTIGIDLELEAQEKNVGPFKADILCKDTTDGHWVLIENQLERTDHTHLGQLITYAAGLKAVTIVWIAHRFTDEHRAAVDWLNEMTGSQINFFGLEVELWRIGDSPIAPKFNMVSKPNDWTKSVTGAAKRFDLEDISPAKQLQLEFWTGFREYLLEESKLIKPQKPLPQHWANFAIGRSGHNLAATVNTRDNRLTVELYIGTDDAKAFFHLLHDQKTEIEAEIGAALDWRELPEKKTSNLVLLRDDVDPQNKALWPDYYTWLKDYLERFHGALAGRVKMLDARDYNPPDENAAIEPE